MTNSTSQRPVPALLKIIASNRDEYERSYAAEALAYYHPAEAIPTLKSAFNKEKSGNHRERYLKALLACGADHLPAKIGGLKKYAERLKQGTLFLETGDLKVTRLAVGAYLAEHPDPTTELIQAISRELAELRKENQALASKLEEIVCPLVRAKQLTSIS